MNSLTVPIRREPQAFNDRKCYLAVLCNCINCYREISNTLKLFLKESAVVTDVTSSSFHLWLCSFLFSFSLPDCYLLANLCQFTGTTFSWTATGGMTGFPRTDKRVAIPSFHLLKWLNGVALNDTTCIRNVFKICHAIQKPKGGHIKQTGDIKAFHCSENSGLLQHDTVQRAGLTYPDVSRKSHDFSFQGGVLDQLLLQLPFPCIWRCTFLRNACYTV